MFTGIIQALGRVEDIQRHAGGKRIVVSLGDLVVEDISLGDSIAVNGACLTVVDLDSNRAVFDVSRETLDKCLMDDWLIEQPVNLEKALTLATPLGGHLVSGHVDGKGELDRTNERGDYTEMTFSLPRSLGRFVAAKGSIAINGVSLTTNSVDDNGDISQFTVMLVPHTLQHTTLGLLQPLDAVHIEIDMLARYVQRLAESDAAAIDQPSSVQKENT